MNEEDDPHGIHSVAGSGVVNSALIAGLLQKLAEKGLLSDVDVREIYDDALHSLEQAQADAAPKDAALYRDARALIEGPLRDTPLSDASS